MIWLFGSLGGVITRLIKYFSLGGRTLYNDQKTKRLLLNNANVQTLLRIYVHHAGSQIHSEYSGFIMPTAESIADALAAKERVRIIPYGDQAAYKLGLSGLQLSNLKYLTDGPSRVINLSEGKKIFFNHTSEVKMFDFCNDTMQMVSSAIRVLTEECLDAEKKRIIHKHLRSVPDDEFMKDITIPPAWVGEIMLDIWNN
mgnify:CR=1 FL=1